MLILFKLPRGRSSWNECPSRTGALVAVDKGVIDQHLRTLRIKSESHFLYAFGSKGAVDTQVLFDPSYMEAVKKDAANRARLWEEIDKKRTEMELSSNDKR